MPRELVEATTTIHLADINKTIIQQKQRRQFVYRGGTKSRTIGT